MADGAEAGAGAEDGGSTYLSATAGVSLVDCFGTSAVTSCGDAVFSVSCWCVSVRVVSSCLAACFACVDAAQPYTRMKQRSGSVSGECTQHTHTRIAGTMCDVCFLTISFLFHSMCEYGQPVCTHSKRLWMRVARE